jgi:hypothetical protein
MDTKVYAVNIARGMAAIEVQHDDHTIIEVTNPDELQAGDLVILDEETHQLFNVTQSMEVGDWKLQNQHVPQTEVRQQLFL